MARRILYRLDPLQDQSVDHRTSQELLSFPDVPEGQCHICRYDLTGNLSGFCPECGTRILNAQQRLAHRIEMVRKHRGDRAGLVVFTLVFVLGVLFLIFGTDELRILGLLLTSFGLMIPIMIWHMVWLRRAGAARQPSKRAPGSGQKPARHE